MASSRPCPFKLLAGGCGCLRATHQHADPLMMTDGWFFSSCPRLLRAARCSSDRGGCAVLHGCTDAG